MLTVDHDTRRWRVGRQKAEWERLAKILDWTRMVTRLPQGLFVTNVGIYGQHVPGVQCLPVRSGNGERRYLAFREAKLLSIVDVVPSQRVDLMSI